MNNIYLLRLEIAGIKNIEKPVEFSFYKKTIKDDFDPGQYRIKAIYGENGSGKTAVMMAVKFLAKIILNRNFLTDSFNQRLLVENINKKTKKGYIEAEFYSTGNPAAFIYKYRVDFEIRDDGRVYIAAEKLDRKPGRYTQNRFVAVFEARHGDLLRFGNDDLFSYCKEKTKNLLEQRSFVTFADDIRTAGYHRASLPYVHLINLLLFAASIYVFIDGEDDHSSYIYNTLPEKTKENVLKESASSLFFSWTTSYGKDALEAIIPKDHLKRYREHIARLTEFVQLFKPDLADIAVDTKEFGDGLIKCRLIMIYNDYELDSEYESRGIRKLMNLFEVLDAASKGHIVFIDELDSNINDVYLTKLIEFFQYYGKGQLCFTAHNLSPMSVLQDNKCSISFLSSINTVHTWTSNGNQNPAHAYRDGFIEDSPFNVDASDFLGILGGDYE